MKTTDKGTKMKTTFGIWKNPNNNEIRIYINGAFDRSEKVWMTENSDPRFIKQGLFVEVRYKRGYDRPNQQMADKAYNQAFEIMKEMNITTWAELLAAAN